jgi:hypothetical protein
VADQDECLAAALLLSVLGVHDGLPLGGFAGDEDLHVIALERLYLPGFTRCAGAVGDAGDAEVGIADDADDPRVEFLLEVFGEGVHRGGRQSEEERILRVLIFLPANGGGKGFGHGFGMAEVPLVVKAPDDEVVVVHVGELLFVDGIVGEERALIAMVVEGGLVGDDQVGVEGNGAAENIHVVSEACHNSGDDCGWVPGFDGVDGVGWRRLRDGLLDARDGLGSGELG